MVATLVRRHPLQKFESPSKGFSSALHLLGLLSFFFSFKFLVDNPNIISTSYGWHFQYLTIIGLTLSTLCFLSGILSDTTNSYPLFTIKNYLSLVAAPIEILISILYWTLRAIDPSLVVPPDLPMLPLGTDLCFHLVPALVLATDALLLSPPWPSSPMPTNTSLITLITSTSLAFLYWFWIEHCYTHNGFYPYPIFHLLSTTQRIGLFTMSGVLMWVVGRGLGMGYTWINGMELVGEEEDKKKKRKGQ